MKNKAIECLKLLMTNELMFENIYKKFAEFFPDYVEFWENIASQERVHATEISKWIPKIESGELFFDPTRFPPDTIQASIDYKIKIYEEVNNKTYSIF